MIEKNADPEGIEGEDFVILTPEKNATPVLPGDIRLVNNTNHSVRIDFRHSNLMVRWFFISDVEETSDKNAFQEQRIMEKIGKEI